MEAEEKSGRNGTMIAINQKPKTLEEILSPHTNQAIKTGKCDSESVEEFNNLIIIIQDGEIIYRRIHEESQPYSRGISEAHAGASSILGGSERTSKTEQRNSQAKRTPKGKIEEDAREGKEQGRVTEAQGKADDLSFGTISPSPSSTAESPGTGGRSLQTYGGRENNAARGG